MSIIESEKEKKNKGRLLSPSFKKGVVKEKSELQDELKINLVSLDEIDQAFQESSVKSIKKKDSDKIEMFQKKNSGSMNSKTLINVFPEGHLKNVGSYSQAGKGEDGFVKVNQDSFLVIQNE